MVQIIKSYEQIRDEVKARQAAGESGIPRFIKDEMFASGLSSRKEEMFREVGLADRPKMTAEEVAAREAKEAAKVEQTRIVAERQAKAAEEAEARAARERANEEAKAAQLIAAKAAIVNGAVIWCDAAQNKNGRYHNGCRIGLLVETEAGRFTTQHYNTKTFTDNGDYDQFASECYGVLKAVELAIECKLTACTIRNDRIGGFDSVSGKKIKKGYIGGKYLYVAKKMAEENGLEVSFDRCTGDENEADHTSRSE